MSKRYLVGFVSTSFILCVITLVGVGQVKQVKEIWVTKVHVETSNRLQITIDTEKSEFKVGENIAISITIKNNSDKSIYLVTKESPGIFNNRGDVLVESPMPIPEEDHIVDCGYFFHQIVSGGSYKGQVMILGSMVQNERDLRIEMGLGFIDNKTVTDLKSEPCEDPMKLRSLLFKQLEVVGIGDLRVLLTHSR